MRGDRLQAYRVKCGYTQESLAAEMKTDKRQITRWENEESVPGGDKIAELSRILNVSADYLLGLSDDPVPHVRIENLSDGERLILAALRRGDKLAVIHLLSEPESA